MTDDDAQLVSCDEEEKKPYRRVIDHWVYFALAVVLASGALGAWWVMEGAERRMRSELLQQARLVAQAIDINRVKALSGTEADLRKPEYRQLKQQLSYIRQGKEGCRFLYIMRRGVDGRIILHVDSELVGSKQYSPPGQVYEEAPSGYRRIFDTRAAAVVGPVQDRWGTWVSALTPMVDPSTGKMIAVMGMDIDAWRWKWDVASFAAVPAGLLLIILIVGVLGIITALSRARLRESEALQQLLLENVEAGIIIIDAGTHIIERVNKKSLELFGGGAEDIVGRTCRSFFCFSGEDHCIGTEPEGGAGGDTDDVLLRTDGSRLPVIRSVRRIRIKGKGKLLETFVDITGRKQMEDNLRWRTALFEAQINTSIDGILVVDADRRILIHNRRMVDLWNIPQGVVDDKISADLFDYIVSLVRDPETFVRKVVYLYEHPYESSRDEIELTNGTVMDGYSAPVLGEDGHYYGRIWTFRDITDRRRAQEEEKRLGKLSAALEVAGAVCHEMNQPLQVISGRIELLSMTQRDDTIRRSLAIMAEQVFRMGEITRKLMGLKEYSNRDYAGTVKITDIDNKPDRGSQ